MLMKPGASPHCGANACVAPELKTRIWLVTSTSHATTPCGMPSAGVSLAVFCLQVSRAWIASPVRGSLPDGGTPPPTVTVKGADGTGRHQRISRFQMTATNNNVALLTSEVPLITQYDEASNHNGGDIHFGPDGMLYIGLGDGGDGGDPFGNGQNLGTLLGKILRIDADNVGVLIPYGIPAGNPFAGVTPGRDEIFALGFRNPDQPGPG